MKYILRVFLRFYKDTNFRKKATCLQNLKKEDIFTYLSYRDKMDNLHLWAEKLVQSYAPKVIPMTASTVHKQANKTRSYLHNVYFTAPRIIAYIAPGFKVS